MNTAFRMAVLGTLLGLVVGIGGCAAKQVTPAKAASGSGTSVPSALQPDTCDYWVPKLTSATDAKKAVGLVSEFKCAAALPILEALFDAGVNRVLIVHAVLQIDSRAASTALLKQALKLKGTARVALSVVADWGAKGFTAELEALLTTPLAPDTRLRALDSLLKIKKASDMEDLLMALAVEDMDFQRYKVNRRAIQELGKMGSVKAIPNLIQAAFMTAVRTNNKRALYRTVRLALAQIGPAAVPQLVEVIRGKNEKLSRYARENGIAPWELNEGPEIMQLLTDSLDPRVVEPIVDNIKTLSKPLGLSPAAEQRWIGAQQNRFTTAMLGLGAVVQDNTGLEKLAKIVADEDADAVRQRLNAARILSYIGTPEAQDKLLDLWEHDKMWVHRNKDLMRAALIVPIVEALDHTRMKRFIKLTKKPSKRVGDKLKDETVVAYLKVTNRCKLDADCWLGKMNSANKWETVKACIMLMRGIGKDQAKVSKVMLDRFAKAKMDEVDMRRFPLMVLARTAGAAAGRKMIELADRSPREDIFWPGELRAMGHALIHKAKKRTGKELAPSAAMALISKAKASCGSDPMQCLAYGDALVEYGVHAARAYAASAAFRKGCDAGDPTACMRIAHRLTRGLGVKMDPQSADLDRQRACTLSAGKIGCRRSP